MARTSKEGTARMVLSPPEAEGHEKDEESSSCSCTPVVAAVPVPVPLPPSGAPSARVRRQTTKKKRHGARNQHKMKDFVVWLRQTFSSGSYALLENVLDIASGKGELAARLALCHQSHVTLVDPRGPADVASVYLQQVVPKLPKKWQERLQERLENNPNFVQDTVDARCCPLVTNFTAETVLQDAALQQAVRDCTILIGMHADSATECIVDVALQHGKPFVVVPCCVFPNLFQQRFIADCHDRSVPVRSWEQFCEYLLQKDHRLRKHTLPFEGRNVAIYWDGVTTCSVGDEESSAKR